MKFINYDLLKKGAYSFIIAGSLTGSLLTLTGCEEQAVTTSKVDPEIMMETIMDGNETIYRPKEHEISVKTNESNEEDLFKLIVNYYTDEEEWRSTSDRALYMDIHTEGLDDKYDVYIDNIHTDTSLVSTFLKYNGIKIDSMDDRIHNSVDRGFSISNDNHYIGINIIEGQNDTVTKIFTSESSSTVETYRVSEEELLEKGVYANKVDSVFGLIIVEKETNEATWIDVRDSIVIPVNKVIEYSNGTYRQYSSDGTYAVGSKVKKL